MSAAQKKVIDDHCTTEWAEKVASPRADFEYAGRAKLAGLPGHEAYKLTPSSSTPGRRRSRRRTQWAADVGTAGYDTKAVMSRLEGFGGQVQGRPVTRR